MPDEMICIDSRYSTTRNLTRVLPVLEKKPDDKFETFLFLPPNKNRKGEGGLRTKGYYKVDRPFLPLITIVSAVYNGEKYLEETIQSVIRQDYDNTQYIIVDGGSSDSTLEIIKKYEDKIDYWISEFDKGIYDAINKGTALVKDGWVVILGADDCLLRGSLTKVSKYLNDLNTVFYGNVLMPNWGKVFGGKFSKYRVMYSNIPHQAIFYPAWLSQKHKYSLKYRIAGDYDYLLKLFCNNWLHFVHIPVVVVVYDDESGVSSNNIDTTFMNDKKMLIKQHFPVILYFFFIVRFFLLDWLNRIGLKVVLKRLFHGILKNIYYQRLTEYDKKD